MIIDLNYSDTLWSGRLDARKFGKGHNASPKLESNLELVDDYRIRDRRLVTLTSTLEKNSNSHTFSHG